jgi:hypothetical protein
MANNDITTISTSQAPDAKPVAKNLTLTTNWQTLIEVPNYEVPELVFGGSNVVEPGVGEVISPLILCNFSAVTVNVDVRTHRYNLNQEFYLIRNMPIPAYDTFALPLNGQFYASGDLLEIKASANLSIDATLSFTLGQSEEDDVE